MWVSGLKNAGINYNHKASQLNQKEQSVYCSTNMAANLKGDDAGPSQPVLQLSGSIFQSSTATLCGTDLAVHYSYILYATGLVSWHKFSLSKLFFFTATSQPPLLWHFIYNPISCIQDLETVGANKIKTAQTDRNLHRECEIDMPRRPRVVSIRQVSANRSAIC